ncbi:MAG: hypothetical protein EA403_11255 [Spirochaetaceae bacterium]|nr:MAG: hypothetical protein EA403_11255 [Spirochaetaceae bacterium]
MILTMRMTSTVRRVLPAALFLAVTAGAAANDLEEAMRLLAEQALSVHIVARITENGEVTMWNMEVSRVTISGRAVSVRLDGSNVVVQVQFTPIQEESDRLVLVARGETWVTVDPSDVQYRTTFSTMPITLGEPVVFFPLGARAEIDATNGNPFNIEIEVRVVPFRTASE